MLPAAVDPVCVGVRRGNIFTRNPDVGIAIPAVIACVPNPVAVFGWERRTPLNDAGGRSNADNHLRSCHERCGKYETTGGGQ